MVLEYDDAEIGRIYYIMVDGCGSHTCTYEFTSFEGVLFPNYVIDSSTVCGEFDLGVLCSNEVFEWVLSDSMVDEWKWDIRSPFRINGAKSGTAQGDTVLRDTLVNLLHLAHDLTYSIIGFANDEPIRLYRIRVRVNPTIPLFLGTVCETAEDTITLNPNLGGSHRDYEYLWHDGTTDTVFQYVGPATYALTVTDKDGCSAEAALMYHTSISVDLNPISDIYCIQSEDPLLLIANTDATAVGPLSFSWSGPGPFTGSGAQIETMSPGWWYCDVIDAYGCVGLDSAWIEPRDNPIALFEIDSIDGYHAFFENTSTDADLFFWSFGDGQSALTVKPGDGENIYAHSGSYTVQLVALNPCGADTAYLTIEIEHATGTPSLAQNPGFLIVPNPNNGSFFVCAERSEEQCQFEIFDLFGRHVYSQELSVGVSGKQEIVIADSGPGVYFAVIRTANARSVIKMLVIEQ
jgi:PKD repeat protein